MIYSASIKDKRLRFIAKISFLWASSLSITYYVLWSVDNPLKDIEFQLRKLYFPLFGTNFYLNCAGNLQITINIITFISRISHIRGEHKKSKEFFFIAYFRISKV